MLVRRPTLTGFSYLSFFTRLVVHLFQSRSYSFPGRGSGDPQQQRGDQH